MPRRRAPGVDWGWIREISERLIDVLSRDRRRGLEGHSSVVDCKDTGLNTLDGNGVYAAGGSDDLPEAIDKKI